MQRGLIPGDTDERTFWTGDGFRGPATPPSSTQAALRAFRAHRISSDCRPRKADGGGGRNSHRVGRDLPRLPGAIRGTSGATSARHRPRRMLWQWGRTVCSDQHAGLLDRLRRNAFEDLHLPLGIVGLLLGGRAGVQRRHALRGRNGCRLIGRAGYGLLRPPPADLHSLVALPNGSFAGASGLDLRLTPAYRPYAWPDDYRFPLDYKIVGLCRFGQYIVALTTGVPYLATASDPISVVPDAIRGFPHACSSRRSIVETNRGVIYAGPSGLCLINPGVRQPC